MIQQSYNSLFKICNNQCNEAASIMTTGQIAYVYCTYSHSELITSDVVSSVISLDVTSTQTIYQVVNDVFSLHRD